MKPSFRLRLLTAYPRLRSMAQVEIRAIVVGGSAVIGADDGDADLVVVTAGITSQRMRLRVSDGGDFDVFTESEVSIRQAIDYGIKDHVVRMLAQGEILVDDGSDLAENRPGCFGSHSRVTRSAPSVRAARSC